MAFFSRSRMANLSRDRPFLVRVALAIVGVSVGLALLLSLLSPAPETPSRPDLADILEDRGREPSGTGGWADFIRGGGSGDFRSFPPDCRMIRPPAEDGERDGEALRLPEEKLGEEAETLLVLLHAGLRLGQLERAIRELDKLPSSLPFRNEFLGDLYFVEGDLSAALRFYLLEVETRPESLYARRSALIAAWRAGDRESAVALLKRADFRGVLQTSERLNLFADLRAFGPLARATVKREWELLRSSSAIPAVFTAAVWFFILMPFWHPSRTRLVAAGVAVGAGILSAGLTLYAVMIQERIQGFVHLPADTPLSQFLYFVAGVGLREEVLKLLCFVPLAIFAARRRSDVEGMVYASLVGLGFAFQENIAYFESGLSSYISWVRFLTANVLHFSLTGVAGFYLYRMILRKFHGVEEFLIAFLAVVLAHGVYNSVLAIPTLQSYAVLSPVLVALIAYRFFDPLRQVMDTVGIRQRISPLGVFVLGSALLPCVALVTSSTQLPFTLALATFASSVAGMVPFAFAFISRFRDL